MTLKTSALNPGCWSNRGEQFRVATMLCRLWDFGFWKSSYLKKFRVSARSVEEKALSGLLKSLAYGGPLLSLLIISKKLSALKVWSLFRSVSLECMLSMDPNRECSTKLTFQEFKLRSVRQSLMLMSSCSTCLKSFFWASCSCPFSLKSTFSSFSVFFNRSFKYFLEWIEMA